MARLHEFQGKAILAKAGFRVPRGGVASSAPEAERIAASLGGPCVVKIQAWTTGRAAIGGVAFADTPSQARDHAARMLGMKVGNFPVTEVLVEEKLAITRELFVSLSIDDKERAPVMLIALSGGSGIEERAANVHRLRCDVTTGPDSRALKDIVARSDLPAAIHDTVADAIFGVFRVARDIEARSVEINPLAITSDGKVVAADCRMTVDDYAVFRHPELGIDIARELDHPPTELERIAYAAEQDDHRGTFYFAQLATEAAPGGKGLIGFHGAGGGGSMMSMDAVTNEGFTIANFCDTSGNPSAAKVYRAARIILSQPGLIGYFGSGSGVASQEQFWSAYGLAKAFWELEINIPVVIRLGGNSEDRAVEILEFACKGLPATVEGYKKSDAPGKIASRFAELVLAAFSPAPGGGDVGASPTERATPSTACYSATRGWTPRPPRRPAFVGSESTNRDRKGADEVFSFPIKGGKVWIDGAAWRTHAPAIIERSTRLLKDEAGRPALAVSAEEFMGKDSELIACEIECRRDGVGGEDGAVFVEMSVPGLLLPDTDEPQRARPHQP